VDQIGLDKVRPGNSAVDLPTRQLASSSPLARSTRADVLGDPRPEILVALPGGRGVEIRDEANAPLRVVQAMDYLTDFGTVFSSSVGKQQIVLYEYPNSEGSGTFRVLDSGLQELVSWSVTPAPGRFTTADWKGTTALFYATGDGIDVRASTGEALARLSASEAGTFQSIRVATLPEDRLVVLLSGNGYTPYHTVCLYDAAGQLLFQEIGDEHAFSLEVVPNASRFVVSTRSTRWQYTVPAASSAP
jgi:hypothetical protein